MGQTITEKILAAHAGKASVKPGDLIQAKLDIVLGNDITAPVAINEFNKLGVDKVFATDRIALIPDHFTPNKDIKSAEQVKVLREFAAKMGITHFYDVGEMGVEHALLPEMGIVGPGDLIIGADSHTCTYGALGAFSTGVGSTDMGIAMATGEAWFKVPESIKFVIKGKKKKWVSGKDLILYIIGQIGVDGARYQAMEFTGPAIKDFSIDERFTIANMAIEAGAKNGIFGVDDVTLEYVKGRTIRPYQNPLSEPASCNVLLRHAANGKFHPRCVAALLDLLGVLAQGRRVGLSDGRSAAVLKRGERDSLRPLVETDDGSVLDLALPEMPRVACLEEGPP